METFSALLAICAGNSPVTGEFPAQRPVTRSFDVFFDLRLNKRLSKQLWGWWLETPSHPLRRHCNAMRGSPYRRAWHFALIALYNYLHWSRSVQRKPRLRLRYSIISQLLCLAWWWKHGGYVLFVHWGWTFGSECIMVFFLVCYIWLTGALLALSVQYLDT